jgi:BMFP domain-containing protein YqiC
MSASLSRKQKATAFCFLESDASGLSTTARATDRPNRHRRTFFYLRLSAFIIAKRCFFFIPFIPFIPAEIEGRHSNMDQTQDLFADASTGGPGAVLPATGAEAPQNEPGAAAEGAGGRDVADTDVVSRAEFNKVVGQRQTAKEKVRQLTAQVDQLLSRLGRMTEQQASGPQGGRLDLQDGKPGRQPRQALGPQGGPQGPADGETPADSQAADLQAVQERLPDPVKAHLEALRGRKEMLEKRLADLLADQELRVAAARANAINPDQVVALLRGRVRMIETADGRYEANFTAPDGQAAIDAGNKPIRDARHLVDAFLALTENANLVRSTVIPGSGARQAGGVMTHTDPMPQSKAEFLALPQSQRLTVANRMTRQQRDTILGRSSADEGGYI